MALDIKTQDEILILTYQSELVAIAKVENNKAKMQKVLTKHYPAIVSQLKMHSNFSLMD